MARRYAKRPRPPLDRDRLNELALTYVGRFATTRAKLVSYLARKLRERGWAAEQPPDLEALVERFADLGYVDDAAYALSKTRALTARGYGARRVSESLRSAGVQEEDSAPAREMAETEAMESALRFARRRRLGPYGEHPLDRAQTEKAIAAMIRAGHSFDIARTILRLEPGSEPSIES